MNKKISILILVLVFSVLTYSQEGLQKSYYSNGKVESEINYSKNVREGLAKFYYDNGNLKEERFYVNGKVEGNIKIYHPNGKIKESANLLNGKREGPVSYFNEEGLLVEEANFRNGYRYTEPVYNVEDEYIILDDSMDTSVVEGSTDEENNQSLPPMLEEKVNVSDEYLTEVEVLPVPAGGPESISKRLYYPQRAKDAKVQGVIEIVAYINELGDVTKIERKNSLGYGLDESAETVVYYTKFKPGLLRGKPVKVKMTIPVEFKL